MYKRLLTFLGFFVILFVMSTFPAFAASYDGKPLDNPYGKLGIEPSYSGVDYYDCLIPYTLTREELGGIATKGIIKGSSKYTASKMPDSVKQAKVGTGIIREGCHDYLGGCANPLRDLGVSFSHDNGFCIATDKNGAKYYVAATGCFYVKSSNDSSSGEFSVAKSKFVFDVILTDGTIIHFIRGDAIGTGHSNGMPNTFQDNVGYERSSTSYPQYAGMFHASAGQELEIWGTKSGGCVEKFKTMYNIGSGDNQNKIASIRMYNISLDNPPARTNGNGVSTSSSGNFSFSGNSSAVSNNPEMASTSTLFGNFLKEENLTGMPTIPDQEGNLPGTATLGDIESVSELYTLAIIREDLSLREEAKVYDFIRVSTVAIGMFLVVISGILFVSVLFDKTNTLLDFSAVEIVSLGLITHIKDDDEASGKKSNTRFLLIGFGVILLAGLFIMSGGVFKWSSVFVKSMYEFFSSFIS